MIVIALTFAASTGQAHAADCAGATTQPGAGDEQQAGRTALCVINQERARRSLEPLRERLVLSRAGSKHARDMVRRHYFSHTSKDGRSFDDRLRGGYLRGYTRWNVGEALAWGTESRATPSAIVEAWLASPPHRALLLAPDFRDLGIGARLGVPSDGDQGATYAAEFGTRRR